MPTAGDPVNGAAGALVEPGKRNWREFFQTWGSTLATLFPGETSFKNDSSATLQVELAHLVEERFVVNVKNSCRFLSVP